MRALYFAIAIGLVMLGLYLQIFTWENLVDLVRVAGEAMPDSISWGTP
jgi:hypothetical protein